MHRKEIHIGTAIAVCILIQCAHACSRSKPEVNGRWSNWSEWSACSATCGEGTQTRERGCNNPRPQNGGRTCTGQSTERRSCAIQACVISAELQHLDGHWSRWGDWSECSTTCGGGRQSRSRDCTNPEPRGQGNKCIGNEKEERDCAKWSCPNVNMQCTAGGKLSQDASFCNCSGTNLTIRILDVTTSMPIFKAQVYVSTRMWQPIADTDATGYAIISDICLQNLTVIAQHDSYMAANQHITTTSLSHTIIIFLTKITTLKMKVQPQSLASFIGGNVRMECAVVGNPPPSSYQWYKNENEMPGKTQDYLTLNNVQITDAAIYRCKAKSDYSQIVSQPAEIIVKSGSGDSCLETPESHKVQLPASCTAPSANNGYLDVKQCTNEVCLSTNKNIKGCCGPVQMRPITVACDGFNYTLTEVVRCGCKRCESGGVALVDGQVEVAGMGPLSLSFTYNNTEMYTDYQGRFKITVPADESQVALLFTPTSPSDPFIEQSKVFKYDARTGNSEVVVLRQRPAKVTLDVFQDSEFQLGDDNCTTLTIPAGSVIDASGNLYTQNVDLYLDFVDPRKSMSEMNSAPGEFVYLEDGEEVPLITQGLFGISVTGSDGQKLYLNGEVTLQIDAAKLNILDSKGKPESYLWVLGENGRWMQPQELTIDTKQRRKRQAVTIVNGVVTITNAPWVNIDKPIFQGRQCQVKVRVYTDETLTSGATGVNVKVFTKQGSTYIGQTADFTDRNGVACVAVPCGYEHEIYTFSTFVDTQVAATQNLPSGISYSLVSGVDFGLVFTSPDFNSVTTTTGPIHVYAAGSCRKSASPDYAFHFHLKDFVAPGQLYEVEPDTGHPLSWYPLEANNQNSTVCMAKVNIVGDPALIAGMSTVTTSRVEDATGALYGTYTSSVQQELYNQAFQACVQVKCPGDVYDTSANTVTHNVSTHFNIQLVSNSSDQCFLGYTGWLTNPQQWLNNGFPGFDEAPVELVSSSNSSVAFKMRYAPTDIFQSLFYGYEIGIGVFIGNGTRSQAYLNALSQCYSSYASIATFICGQEPRMPT